MYLSRMSRNAVGPLRFYWFELRSVAALDQGLLSGDGSVRLGLLPVGHPSILSSFSAVAALMKAERLMPSQRAALSMRASSSGQSAPE